MSSASIHPEADTGTAKPRLSERAPWQVLMLTALYAFPALVCARVAVVGDPDIWFHLRTAQWILLHHAVPHTDPFTSFAAGTPWTAYSWLFDLVVLTLYRWLGLNGLVVYTAGMLVAITMALHRMVRRLHGDFASGAWLTLIAIVCTAHIWTPRSWMFSILFFTIQLDLLMHARRTGKCRELWFLPVLYLLWANLHIEFVYGLAVLGIALLESAFAFWWDRTRTPISLGQISAVVAACVAATLVNPYGWNLYTTAFGLSSLPGILNHVIDFQPMQFQDPLDYGVLFLGLAAAGMLARVRRRRLFEFLLLIFATVVSFHWQRDLWLEVTAACSILAAGDDEVQPSERPIKALVVPLALIAGAAAAILGFMAVHLSNERLVSKLGETLPVSAANFVKTEGLKGPLYNTFNWGGYLMWNPGLSVSIDGRAQALKGGSQVANRSTATWAGAPDWACDPQLQKAQLVIGPITAPLTQLLRLNSHFKLAYEDKLAAVFVVREPSPESADGPAPLPCASARR